MNKKIKRSKGLSLIELILALIILTIISVSIFTISLNIIQTWQDKTIIDSIYNYLERAHEQAIIENKTIEIPIEKLTKNLKLSEYNSPKYKIAFNGFHKKDLIIFTSNNSPKKDYSNGTLYIKNTSSNKSYRLVINKAGKIIKK